MLKIWITIYALCLPSADHPMHIFCMSGAHHACHPPQSGIRACLMALAAKRRNGSR